MVIRKRRVTEFYVSDDRDVTLLRRTWYPAGSRKGGPCLEWFDGEKWFDEGSEANWKLMLSILDCEAEEVYVW